MDRERFQRILLHITLFLVIFYPFKGLFSAGLSIILGENVSFIIIRFALIFVVFFILLNTLSNGIVFVKKTDKILFYFFLIGILAGIAQYDLEFIYIISLLLGLPILFSRFQEINDEYFFKVVYLFFLISTFYLAIEHILLHPKYFDLGIEPISTQQFLDYSHLLVGTSASKIADFRFGLGGYIRTSGYLGHVLAMPVLISMGSVFFYVLVREKLKLTNLILSLISAYLCITCLSTTAIGSFLLAVITYELYIRRNNRSFSILLLILFGIFSYIKFSLPGNYLYLRLIENISDPNYYSAYFSNTGLLEPINLIYLLIGKWNWETPLGVTSHIDLILIPINFGLFVSYLIYMRMLKPLLFARKYNNTIYRAFALPILTAFFCLFHAAMTLNINIMFLVSALLVKSNNFSQSLRNNINI